MRLKEAKWLSKISWLVNARGRPTPPLRFLIEGFCMTPRATICWKIWSRMAEHLPHCPWMCKGNLFHLDKVQIKKQETKWRWGKGEGERVCVCVCVCVCCKEEDVWMFRKATVTHLASEVPATGLTGHTSCVSQSSSCAGLPPTNCIDLWNRQLCNCLSTFNLFKLSQLHIRHTIWNSLGCL